MVSRAFVLGLAWLLLLGCEVGETVKSEKPQAENAHQSLQSVPLPQAKIMPPKEGRIRYTYNANNQIQEIQGPGPRKVALSYDERGRLSTMKSGQSMHSYQYNRLNHLKQINDSSGTTNFQTFPDGKLKAIVYPSGDTVTQEYSEVGGIASVKWGKHHSLEYQRDLLGYIVAIKTPIGIIKIDYDHNKPFMQRQYPNGAFSQFFYDKSGMATRILHVAPNKRQIFEFNYTYDDAGRLAITHERGPKGDVSITYTYDAYGQLREAAYSDGRLYTYEYDLHGNRLKMSGPAGTMTATYDVFDHLLTNNGQPVVHDEAGNVTSFQGGTLGYNEQDLLVKNGPKEYSYNALGLRVEESSGKGKTQFFHVMDTLPYVLAEKNGKETTKYLWADGSYFGQIENNTRTLLFFEDHLGSIRGAMDMEGNVVGIAEYSPFGIPIQRIPGVRYGYAGEPQDERGKVYLRARYYDPMIGRFLSKDQVLPNFMDEAKQNRYAYVNNSPLNFKDCDGNQANSCSQCYLPPLVLNPMEIDPTTTINALSKSSVGRGVLNGMIRFGNDLKVMLAPLNKETPTFDEVLDYLTLLEEDDEFNLVDLSQIVGEEALIWPLNWDVQNVYVPGYGYSDMNYMVAARYMPIGVLDQVILHPARVLFQSVYTPLKDLGFDYPVKLLAFGKVAQSKRARNNSLLGDLKLAMSVTRDARRKVIGDDLADVKGWNLGVAMAVRSRADQLLGKDNWRSNPQNKFNSGFIKGNLQVFGLFGERSKNKYDKYRGQWEQRKTQPANRPSYGSATKRNSILQESKALADHIMFQINTIGPILSQHDISRGPGQTAGPGGYASSESQKALEAVSHALRSSRAPNVGGVYLDKAAEVLGDLSSLEGVTFDPVSNRLIFIGADHAQTSLPPMRIDDLAVALRSVFGNFLKEPGVSIDPKPENPRAAKMDVNFFGGVENTHFGLILFESDRIMKGLSQGEDNESHEKLRVSVDGFYNLLELANSNLGGSYKENLWSRFWLKPDRVVVQVSKDKKTITFPDTKIRVETETMRWENGALVPAKDEKDEKAEYFAAHFTKFYDLYSKEFPVFGQLKMLANLVGLAKWLKEAQVPVDLSWLDRYEKYFKTPVDTNSHTVQGRGLLPGEVISIFGGADLTVQPLFVEDQDHSAGDLGGLALKAVGEVPGVVSTTMVPKGREKKRVLALPTSQTRVPGSKFLREWELEFISRIFSSLHNEPTVFGHSWVLDLPQLRIGQLHKGKEEYAVLNNQKIKIRTFHLIRPFGLQNLSFSKHVVDQEYQQLVFLADQRDGIRGLYPDEKRKEFRIDYDNGQKDFFNDHGYLIKREFNQTSTHAFGYDSGNRLMSVQVNDDGESQTWKFSYDEKDRLISVVSDQKTILYKYDEQENLSKVVSGFFITEYEYDARHFVAAIRQDGQVVRKLVYNDLGQIQSEENADGQVSHPEIRRKSGNTIVIEHVDGRPVTRTYDAGGRVLTVEDGSGSLVEMKYTELGVLKSIAGHNTFGDPFRLELSANNRHEKYIDSEDNVSALLFDELGRLQQVQDGSHALVDFEYGMTDRGKLETSETSEIKAQTLFDKQGRPVESIIDSRSPLGGQIITGLQYDRAGNVRSKTVKGLLNLKATYEEGRLVEQRMGGVRATIRYDFDGKVRGIESNDSSLSLEYGGKEKLLERLSFERGQFTTHYEFSNGSLQTRENSMGLRDQFFADNEGKVKSLKRRDGETWAFIQEEHSLKAIRNDSLQWQFSFDDKGRLVESFY